MQQGHPHPTAALPGWSSQGDAIVMGSAPVPRYDPSRRVALLRGFIGSIATVAGGDALAKVLAFAFYALTARLLSQEEFGLLRYAVSAGLVGATLVGAASLSLSYFVAEARHSPAELGRRTVTGSLVILALTLASAALTGVVTAGAGEAWLEATLICLGLSAAYYYLHYTKGIEAFGRAGIFPVLSNIVQLALAAGAIFSAGLRHGAWMALAYSSSYWIVIAIYERGVSVDFRRLAGAFDRPFAGRMARFTLPIVVRHGAYTLLFSIDLLLLKHFSSGEELALYSATKTLATAFIVAPYAVFSVLMPRTTTGRSRGFGRDFWVACLGTGLASLGLLALFAAFGSSLLELIFGPGYGMAGRSLVPVGIGMALYSLAVPVDAILTARGRPDLLGWATVAGLAVATPCAFATIPAGGQVAAGLTFLAGVSTTVATLFFWTWLRVRLGKKVVQG